MEILERNIMVGDGTDYAWDGQIGGLGEPEVRNTDVDKGHGDGATSQHDYYTVRTITLPVSIAPAPGESPSRTVLWQRWMTLRDGWVKAFDQDLTLEHVEPGETVQYLGRPNGVTLDDSAWRRGNPLLRVLLSFRCADPTRY